MLPFFKIPYILRLQLLYGDTKTEKSVLQKRQERMLIYTNYSAVFTATSRLMQCLSQIVKFPLKSLPFGQKMAADFRLRQFFCIDAD